MNNVNSYIFCVTLSGTSVLCEMCNLLIYTLYQPRQGNDLHVNNVRLFKGKLVFLFNE